MFTNNGYIADSESPLGFRGDNNGIPQRMVMNDLLTLPDMTRFIPIVIQTVVREALEPNPLIVPNCFQTINAPTGRVVQIGAVGAMAAGIVPETGEYPTQDLDLDGGDMVSVSIQKHGLMVRVTDEVVEESQWDIVGMWLRAAGRALARHKETFAYRLLNEMGQTVFDNRTPSGTVDPLRYGTLSGRDLSGTPNGSMNLNDVFDMYAYLVMRGFTPDTLIMHPLAWSTFMTDPEMREIVVKGATLATNRLPNGTFSPGWGTSHEGRGLRTTATGAGSSAGYGGGPDAVLGKIGANPWVASLNPLAASFNIQPNYLPSPLKVLVSPYTPYTASGTTISSGTPSVSRTLPITNIAMLDSSNCGILIQRTPVSTEEFDDPLHDIRAIKIMEKWGMQLLEQGKAVAVARDVVIARNYVFENSNAQSLVERDITSAIVT